MKGEKEGEDGNEAKGRDKSFPAGNSDASRDLFRCQTTLDPTSPAPCGEDVSKDVLGHPWEETLSGQITVFCQITTDAFDVLVCK